MTQRGLGPFRQSPPVALTLTGSRNYRPARELAELPVFIRHRMFGGNAVCTQRRLRKHAPTDLRDYGLFTPHTSGKLSYPSIALFATAAPVLCRRSNAKIETSGIYVPPETGGPFAVKTVEEGVKAHIRANRLPDDRLLSRAGSFTPSIS